MIWTTPSTPCSPTAGDDRETTFAEQVRALITEELKDIETLIFISDSSRDLDTEIERRWDRIADHLDKLFPNEGSRLLGQNTPKLRNGRIDTEEVVEEIQDVLAALRTSTSFQNAIEDGIFSASRQVDADDSDDIFFAVSSVTKLGFGLDFRHPLRRVFEAGTQPVLRRTAVPLGHRRHWRVCLQPVGNHPDPRTAL